MSADKQYPVRLDARGEPDVAFYINNAHRMRAEATAAWLHEATRWLKSLRVPQWHGFHLPSLHH